MPTNLVADPTLATATIAGDGTLVENEDGTWRVDFTGQGGSWLNVPLSAALIDGHRYDIICNAGGTPHNLKGQLLQDGGSGPATIGNPPNLWAAGTYSATITFHAPVGHLKVWNYVMSGQPFSVEGASLSVIDLDAAA